MKYVLSLFLFIFSDASLAQSKFFSTPNRGGVEGAKQNVILTILQNEQQRMNNCTVSGMIFAPTHANADAGGCLPIFTIDPDFTSIAGGLAIDGAVKIGGSAETCDGSMEGTIHYNTTSQQMEFCNGTSWVSMVGGGGGTTTTCSVVATNSVYSPTGAGEMVYLGSMSAADCQSACGASGYPYCSRLISGSRCYGVFNGPSRICSGTGCGCAGGGCYDRRWDCN